MAVWDRGAKTIKGMKEPSTHCWDITTEFTVGVNETFEILVDPVLLLSLRMYAKEV